MPLLLFVVPLLAGVIGVVVAVGFLIDRYAERHDAARDYREREATPSEQRPAEA